VAEALNTGYRLIDTAMVYGNEKGVGAAIRDSKIPRDEIFLTTKLWNSDQGYESGLKAFETSLTRLGLDYVDLYLIHWPRGTELTRESWKALEEIHASGRAKNIGVSNFDVDELKELLSYAKTPPAVNQIELHPFIYKEQRPVVEYCQEKGIVVEAYSPLAQAKQMNHPVINEIAEQSGKTAGQVMLRWAVQQGTVPIPKTSHQERMAENLDIFDFELSEAQMTSLDGLSAGKSVL
jgi:diketogulonate reductase-like aldo/keto reductase